MTDCVHGGFKHVAIPLDKPKAIIILVKTKVQTFRTHKTPADINVLVVFAPFAWSEVVGTQEAVIGQWDASRSHTVVIGVVGHGAAHAAG